MLIVGDVINRIKLRLVSCCSTHPAWAKTYTKAGETVKLKRAQFYVGKSKAQHHVEQLAKSLNIVIPKPRDFGADVHLKTENKTFSVNFGKEVDHTVRHGQAKMLQAWFDAEDRFLQPAIEISASSTAPGVTFTLTSSLGSHSASVSNHGILESPELALSRDICFFHMVFSIAVCRWLIAFYLAMRFTPET
jgi:hypothetical protein